MRPLLRGIARLLTALGTAILLAASLLGGVLWLTLPPRQQTLRIPGLSASVEITIDHDGVPRIRAANTLDADAALGYLHARDRMFQMDLMRRNAAGRLSEIAGPATLPLDKTMRTLGLHRVAEADYADLHADTQAALQAYARGVNAWIAQRGRFAAPEFLLLGRPRPWTPVDSLLWGETMGLWLSLNWRTELSREALAGRVPPQLIAELWPDHGGAGHPEAALTLEEPLREAAADLVQVLPHFPSPYTLPETASNEWAVDGRHTASGAPLLAGDPHLAFGFPGIWYLARIDTPSGTLAGATAPGVPGMIIGHNSHIAWTFTTTGADTQDVFVEQPVGKDEYATPDGPRPFIVHHEVIKVRGEPDVVLNVRETRHGPVISDLRGPGGPVLAVEMANLAPGDTAATGLFMLNQARSVEEAGKAAAMITSPVQNLLVADRHAIGLFVTGRVPIRRAGDGSAPVPGDGSYDWVGWASGDHLPHVVAPASGRLVNGNERIAPRDFPVFLGRDWFGDWRARRIRQMLDATTKFTPADFARMQTDVVSTFAERILPVLRSVPRQPGTAGQAQALLTDWDGAMTRDAPQPLIFNAWVDEFYALLLRNHSIPLAHGGPIPDFVAWVLTPAGAHWCNGDCTRDLATSLAAAVDRLSKRFGANPSAWRWGTAHPAVFAHPFLSHIPVINALTTIKIASPGDGTTVDRGGPLFMRFQSVHGASFRGAFDLADLNRSLFIVTPGQSGNPLSPLSRNFVRRWRDGETITLGPKAAKIGATIRLVP